MLPFHDSWYQCLVRETCVATARDWFLTCQCILLFDPTLQLWIYVAPGCQTSSEYMCCLHSGAGSHLVVSTGFRGCMKGFQFQKKDFNLLEEPGTLGIGYGCPEESLVSTVLCLEHKYINQLLFRFLNNKPCLWSSGGVVASLGQLATSGHIHCVVTTFNELAEDGMRNWIKRANSRLTL